MSAEENYKLVYYVEWVERAPEIPKFHQPLNTTGAWSIHETAEEAARYAREHRRDKKDRPEWPKGNAEDQALAKPLWIEADGLIAKELSKTPSVWVDGMSLSISKIHSGYSHAHDLCIELGKTFYDATTQRLPPLPAPIAIDLKSESPTREESLSLPLQKVGYGD